MPEKAELTLGGFTSVGCLAHK